MPLREIDADPDRFQPRDAAFSEESVERIVSRFDERELDPLRVWTDPEDGRTYVLAGHSRREAIRRLQDRGDLPLDYEVPIDPYEGTEAEARDFAGRENNSRTAQTPNEDAAALRVATEGMSRSAAQEKARQRYGRNGALVYALSRLSPTGKAVQDLRAFGKSRTKEARDVLTMAQWLGLARDRHEALTDPHERELYDWLRKEWGGRRQPRTQTDWVQFVDDVVGRRSFLGTFDATAPLNLAELPARADLEIDAAIAEADAVLREAQRDRARAEKDFVERGADGDALRRALAPLDDAVRVAQREALRVREEAGRARGEVQKQRGLFGEPGEGRTLGPGTPLDSNTAPGGAPLDDAATGTPEAGPGTRAEGEPDPVGAVGVRASGRPPGGSDGAPGVSAPGGDVAGVVDGGRAAEQGGAGLSDGAPAAPGAGGDRGVQGDASGTGGRSTGGAEPVGSGSPRAEGARPDGRGGASALLDPSAGPLDADERASGIDLDGAPRRDGLNEPPPALQRPGLDERRRQQAEADRDSARNGVHLGDAADVRRSLPVLLAEQQEDVVKAERRFFGAPTAAEREAGAAIQDPRRGVLFTNGTGTGKTYTGLGIVKRHVLAGKRDVLIVVPTDQKAKDWIEDARNLSLQVEQLATTATAGEGVVVTTYANLARNQALLDERDFDLVVYDESHRLLQNAQGDRTAAMDAHLAVTNHPDAVLRKLVHRDPDLRRAKRAADEAREAWIEAGVDEDLKAAWAAAHDEYMRLWYAREKDAALVAEAAELVKRTRTVFLSATPFAYHKTMQYADGYLFESPTDEERRGEYNQAQGFDLFLQQQLGYHMKTGRLQQPEAEVDTSFMERELHAKLAEAGAVSGRTLELDADYSRDFFRVSSGIGEQIDEGLSWLWE
ncbi:MAG TPA: DEAD/DEAH box helicase, partial [Rhodothermales bacterium]|nr:DEAD/DEAH box helicase [Rhodothermales bacterium]